MKVRKIRKVRALAEGWLSVDKEVAESTDLLIAFFTGQAKPELEKDGCWRTAHGCRRTWVLNEWHAAFGRARLPKPGKCERVKLELD